MYVVAPTVGGTAKSKWGLESTVATGTRSLYQIQVCLTLPSLARSFDLIRCAFATFGLLRGSTHYLAVDFRTSYASSARRSCFFSKAGE
jgi:hypothetical protein